MTSHFEMEDARPGIPGDLRTKVFERFQQGTGKPERDRTWIGTTPTPSPSLTANSKNVMGCALILSSGKPRRAEHLQLYEMATPATQLTAPINLDLESAEQTLIQRTLGRTHGNAAEAARLLNISRRRIYRKFLHLVSGVQKPPLPAAGSVRNVSF